MEREWVYRCPDIASACKAVQCLDTWPQDKLVGLAIVAKGWAEDSEEFYLFANTDGVTDQEVRQVESILAEFGEPTDWTFATLCQAAPQPHFMASGLAPQILMATAAQYPDDDIPEYVP